MSFRHCLLEGNGDVNITHIIDDIDDGEWVNIEDKRWGLTFFLGILLARRRNPINGMII